MYRELHAQGSWFVVFCCGVVAADFTHILQVTSLALGQSYDCPSASEATLVEYG